jgi:dihydroneopterin aldolase
MDCIYLRDIQLEATIGVYDWEQRIRQKLLLTLELGVDCRKAGQSDALADALDYGAVLTRVQALVEDSRYALLEKLATVIAETLLAEFSPLQTITVDLAKLHIFAQVPKVGVVIRRER